MKNRMSTLLLPIQFQDIEDKRRYKETLKCRSWV